MEPIPLTVEERAKLIERFRKQPPEERAKRIGQAIRDGYYQKIRDALIPEEQEIYDKSALRR